MDLGVVVEENKKKSVFAICSPDLKSAALTLRLWNCVSSKVVVTQFWQQLKSATMTLKHNTAFGLLSVSINCDFILFDVSLCKQYRSQNWGTQCSVKLMSALSTREYFDIFTTATSYRPQSAVSLESQLQRPGHHRLLAAHLAGLLGWDTRRTKECGTFIPASVLNRIWDFLHSDLHQEGLARIF